MSRITRPPVMDDLDYPTRDGKPMAETELHMRLMAALIQMLEAFFAAEPQVYVWGNMLMFYERGNKRRHVSPDIFVVRGVVKHMRDNYLIWREGKAPQVVIELTSRSTRSEDTGRKFALYRDVLQVKEYFLFDPRADYLNPPMQGYRLRGGKYIDIRAVEGRLPSRELGLHLERDGNQLRLWNPATGQWLLTPEEARDQETQARRQAEAEVERLRRENEELRRRLL
jgi:Uma2 family endonuclease